MKLLTAVMVGTLSLFTFKPCAVTESDRIPQDNIVKAAEISDVPENIRIDEIGIDTKIVAEGLGEDNLMIVPDSEKIVSWYNLGVKPGEKGSAVLAGHNNWNGKPGEFGKLKSLKGGEIIHIKDNNGKELNFTVNKIEVFDTDKFPTEDIYTNKESKKLRLITCHGKFVTGKGTYDQRLVVTAELTEQ